MKITEITIRLEPNKNEEVTQSPLTLMIKYWGLTKLTYCPKCGGKLIEKRFYE